MDPYIYVSLYYAKRYRYKCGLPTRLAVGVFATAIHYQGHMFEFATYQLFCFQPFILEFHLFLISPIYEVGLSTLFYILEQSIVCIELGNVSGRVGFVSNSNGLKTP